MISTTFVAPSLSANRSATAPPPGSHVAAHASNETSTDEGKPASCKSRPGYNMCIEPASRATAKRRALPAKSELSEPVSDALSSPEMRLPSSLRAEILAPLGRCSGVAGKRPLCGNLFCCCFGSREALAATDAEPNDLIKNLLKSLSVPSLVPSSVSP